MTTFELSPPALTGVVMMTRDEAKDATRQINQSLGDLRRLIDDFDQREGWAALGWSSFRDWARSELDQISIAHVYRLRDAAAVDRSLGVSIGDTPESHARVLKQVPEAERPAVLERADELASDQPRQAKHIEQAAQAVAPPTPRGLSAHQWAAGQEQAAELGAVLTYADGEYCIVVDGERKVTSQWAMVRSLLFERAARVQVIAEGRSYRAHTIDGRLSGERTTAAAALQAAHDMMTYWAPTPAPLPVVPSLDQDRIAALAARDIRYISSERNSASQVERHRIRGPFGEQLLTLDKIDEVIATIGVALALPPAEQIPADCLARAAALGLRIEPSTGEEGGWVPLWPEEQVEQMIGSLEEALRDWLTWDAPIQAARRLAEGKPTLPGVTFINSCNEEDFHAVADFAGNLAAAELDPPDGPRLAELTIHLEGLADVLSDESYSALATRLSALRRGNVPTLSAASAPPKLADVPSLTQEELAELRRGGWEPAGGGVSELGEAFVAMRRNGETTSRTRVAWRWEIARLQEEALAAAKQPPPLSGEPAWLDDIRAALRVLVGYPVLNPANPANLAKIERAARTIVAACEQARTA
jgi:hypothetical protein